MEGAPKRGAVIFFEARSVQQFCEPCWGRSRHRRTNHVHSTMHILDVISSVSRSSKCTKIVGGGGFAPDPTGELTAFPQIHLGVRGPTLRPLLLRGEEGRAVEARGRQNDPCPWVSKKLAPALYRLLCFPARMAFCCTIQCVRESCLSGS